MLKTIAKIPLNSALRNNGETIPQFINQIKTNILYSSAISISHTVRAMSKLSSFETLAVTQPSPYVHHVQLNRPDKFNAFNQALWK